MTIFEVLDNYFGSSEPPDVYKLNGGKIRVLREHLLAFYDQYSFPPPGDFQTRLFLGGFLSSPPFLMEAAPYLSSALLLSDSLILYDPLHFWLCEEQYSCDRLSSAPSGWLDINTGQPNYPLTRMYLEQVLTWLYQVRSLVEKGIILLIPAERIALEEEAKIQQLSRGICYLFDPVQTLSKEYPPDEITVDDNRKGLFEFTGSQRVNQIVHSIGSGVKHFARDIILANASGAIYTAPFKWEQTLARRALNEFFEAAYHTSIIKVIRNLRLPILTNLAPDLLESLYEDSCYAEYRSGLSEMLREVDAVIGSDDFNAQVAQIEIDLLVPKIQALFKKIQSPEFISATNAALEGVFTFSQGFIGNVFTNMDFEINSQSSGVLDNFSFLHEQFMNVSTSSEHRIWAHLIPEDPSASTYYRSPIMLKEQGETLWDIADLPSTKIRTSTGLLKPSLIYR